MLRLLVLAALVLTSGCGGVISSVYIIYGQVALAGARAANAEKLATYEYTSADAYLRKAREAHSYADFEHSLRFARLATERAQKARKIALDANKPPPDQAQPPPTGQQPPPNAQPVPVQPPPGYQQPPPGYQQPPPGYQQPPPGYQQPPPGYPQQPPPPQGQRPPSPQEQPPPVIIRKVPEQPQPSNP